MTKLILLIILALATWYYFPETRAILLDVTEPIVAPIIRWSTQDEMAQIGRNVVDYERLTGELPVGPAWLGWLDFRYANAEVQTDPWGSIYQLAVVSDSVWILSYGPDRIRDTNDDFQVVTVRNP